MNAKRIKFSWLFIMIFALAVAVTGCNNVQNVAETTTPEAVTPEPTTPEPTTPEPTTPEPTTTPEPETTTPEPDIEERSDEYVYISKIAGDVTEYSVDVTGMKNYGINSDYYVTVLYEDDSYTQEIMKADENGKVNVAFDKKAVAIELSVVFKFSVGKDSTGLETDGFIKVAIDNKYDDTKEYGFDGIVVNSTNGADMWVEASSFVAKLPDGRYDITVVKGENKRGSVLINGGAFGVNVQCTGDGRNGGSTEYRTYTAKDVVVEGGIARFSMMNSFRFSTIEYRRASELIPRKRHIYIAGDSTVQSYYPLLFDAEPAAGTTQTGWGQLFEYYVTDEVIVDAWGAGGTYAKSWHDLFFQGIRNNAQPGDYFIIQFGINDRSYSNVDEMVEYLAKMADECIAMGVIPVLVTTQQLAWSWRDANNQAIEDYGTPEGGGIYEYMAAIRKLAADKELLFIDNAALTSEWYTKVGRIFVEQNYHIYDFSKNEPKDKLHSSYAGSKKITELIVTEIARQISEGITDKYGNTLAGIPLNPIIEYDFEYVDSTGATVKTTISAVDYELYK